MEEKETIEKDVDLLDDITKFTVLPPKRERNKEEEEPVSKGSRILSLVYVSIGAALALTYLVLAFVFGRRYDGFNSEKGYGILPILFSSLAGLFAAGSFVLFYLKKKNKKSLFSSLALSSSLLALLSLYFSYSFSVLRKDVIDKRNRAGNNFFGYTYLVILCFAVVFAVSGIISEFLRKPSAKKKIVESVIFVLFAFLLYPTGAILANPISYSASGITLSVFGSCFLASGFIVLKAKGRKDNTNLVIFLLTIGWVLSLTSFLHFGLLTPSPLY